MIIPGLFAVLAPIIPLFLMISSQAFFAQVNDFPEFYAAVKMFIDGRGPVVYVPKDMFGAQSTYFPAIPYGTTHFLVTPLALPLMIPVALIPLAQAPYIWTGALLLSIAGAIAVLRKAYKLDAVATLWLIAVMSVYGPVYETIRIGQLAPFLLLFMSGAIWALKANKPVVFAVCASFLLGKPQYLAPFIVFMIGAGKWRPVAYLAACAVVLGSISLAVMGISGIEAYLRLSSETMRNITMLHAHINPTLRGQLFLLFPGIESIIPTISLSVFAVAMTLVFLMGRAFKDAKNWVDVALIVALPLGSVFAVYMQFYDLVLLVPAVLSVLKTRLMRGTPDWASILWLIAAGPFFLPFSIYIHYGFLLKYQKINPFFWLLFVGTAVILTVVWRRRRMLIEEDAC